MDSNIETEIDESFIPKGYKYFKVKQNTADKVKFPARLLFYDNDLLNVDKLMEMYLNDVKINKSAFGKKSFYFRLQNVGILKGQTYIAEIKNKLHNQKIKTLEFIPILHIADQQFQFQCSNNSDVFKDHPEYKQFEAEQNKIQFCLQFTQINQVYYADFIGSKAIHQEVSKFLQSKTKELGKDLSSKNYKIKCKGCGQKVEPSTIINYLAHFTIQILFEDLVQIPRKPFMEKIFIKIIRGIDQVIKQIPYNTIIRKKVKSILEECQLKSLKVIDSYGLKILNTVIKPIQFLSKVQSSLCVMKQATIQAFIIEQSELFYSIESLFKSSDFDLSEIKQTLNSQQVRKQKEHLLSQIYTKRQLRISETPAVIHKQSSFIDPILGYTSQLYYRQLNQYLRDTNFGTVPQSQYMKYQYKFSFALIKSLMKIPSYEGLVFRGIQFRDVKSQKGDIISFNSFTSTSLYREKALQFGKKTLYTIRSLTGKNITQFSYFKTEGEVLFMPYTYFEVVDARDEKIGQDESRLIQLRELPIPRREQSNILLWVDDDATEGSRLYQTLFIKYPNITTELIQILSNDHLQLWLNKFGSYLTKKIKISLITDMKRGQSNDEGIKTIKILTKHLKNIDIFIYILNIEKTKQTLGDHGLQTNERIRIGNTRKQVIEFIKQKVVDKSQLITKDSSCFVM